MAKYVIEIPDDRIGDFVGNTNLLMPYTMAGHKGHHDTGLKLTPYTEPDEDEIRKQAHEEAWEFVRGLIHCNNGFGMNEDELRSCFGYELYSHVFKNLTYLEAKAKYESWQKQKDEIHEYDEIISEVPDNKAVIVRIDCWGQWHCVNSDGIFMVEINQQGYWKKTGRSFPELGDVLKKMGEE